MVDISDKLIMIKAMIDEGDYFCINRARQYGKTTTLSALRRKLSDEYEVLSLSFQKIGEEDFGKAESFVKILAKLLLDEQDYGFVHIPDKYIESFERITKNSSEKVSMDDLFRIFRRWCRASTKKIVLMIDEVDYASDNQVFLDFLAQLRSAFLEREDKGIQTFHSVILSGVTDVRHLKRKIRLDGDHKENSPWNIASDFTIDMSLSEAGIKKMLDEYEADHHIGMNTIEMAALLRKYTNGYPYLVSRLCQLMDFANEQSSTLNVWTEQGLDEAIKYILSDGSDSLFGSLMSKLMNLPVLKNQLRDILLKGDVISWKPDDTEQQLLFMYGFIVNDNNTIRIANRLFEMRIYNYFVGESRKNDAFRTDALLNKSIFINDDHTLNMPLILDHFVETQRRVHGDADERFLEEEGRERFLTYLSPIINGTGTYSIEEQTRNQLRMDVVIHYLGNRYVVELKIWRGQRYNAKGEQQIMDYLDYFNLTTGYMVSFNFNKSKRPGVERLIIGDKTLFEAIV